MPGEQTACPQCRLLGAPAALATPRVWEQPTLPPRSPAELSPPDTSLVPFAGDVEPLATQLPEIPGYEIEKELHAGGMGVVYQARQLRLDLPVALKMIRSWTSVHAQDLVRFRTEARAVAALNHPNIVRIYDYGEHDGLPYFSMELIEGGSLAELLRRGPLPLQRAARLIEELARAMHYVHGCGLIHRDLKPGNILLQAKSEAGVANVELRNSDFQAKIADFGLAKRLEEDQSLTSAGTVMGTASYMAPEQVESKGLIGPPADIYALGALLHEAITGRPPFLGDSRELTMVHVLVEEPKPPSVLRPEVPAALDAICLRCLEKLPGRRYATAGELAADLHRFQLGEPVHADASGDLAWHERWAQRHGFEILDIIACGRTGFLYRARQLSLQRQVALKVMPASSREDERELAAFRREAALIARLHHPHIVQIFDLGERGGVPYFVMELIEGKSLGAYFGDGPAPLVDAARLMAQLARAVEHAHQRGVVHCCIKPGSVIVMSDEVKLTCFGLARIAGETYDKDLERGVWRLVSYLAPEQIEDRDEAIGPATDIYSLGATLYSLLTGQPPFAADSMALTRELVLHEAPLPPSQLQAGVPADLDAACLRCLEKEPLRRFGSAGALAQELERYR
jgi:serine/threonine protein kinase